MIFREEIEWAIKQLEALEYIRFSKERDYVFLTEKGKERADYLLEMLFKVDERLLVMMHCGEISAELGIEWRKEE